MRRYILFQIFSEKMIALNLKDNLQHYLKIKDMEAAGPWRALSDMKGKQDYERYSSLVAFRNLFTHQNSSLDAI